MKVYDWNKSGTLVFFIFHNFSKMPLRNVLMLKTSKGVHLEDFLPGYDRIFDKNSPKMTKNRSNWPNFTENRSYYLKDFITLLPEKLMTHQFISKFKKLNFSKISDFDIFYLSPKQSSKFYKLFANDESNAT